MVSNQFPEWLPKAILNKCSGILDKDVPPEDKAILKRLLTDERMVPVYKAIKKRCQTDKELVNYILGVWSSIIEVKSYRVMDKEKFKDRLTSISNKAQRIAEDLIEIKKAGIVLPGYLDDSLAFIVKFHRDQKEKKQTASPINQLDKRINNLRTLRYSGMSLINAFNKLSEYSSNSSKLEPVFWWKEDFEGKPSKKKKSKTEKGIIPFHKRSLILKLGALNKEFFDTPLNQTIATLAAIGLNLPSNKDKFAAADYVKKVLRRGTKAPS